MADLPEPTDNWLSKVQEAVQGLKYGTVQIIVHDGRVVQIERTERFRYEKPSDGNKKAAPPQAPN